MGSLHSKKCLPHLLIRYADAVLSLCATRLLWEMEFAWVRGGDLTGSCAGGCLILDSE